MPSRHCSKFARCPRLAWRGVTLLELIIVIAIIGILVSLLFPAIQFALTMSRTAACDNNLRQLDLALRGYIDATRSHFPLPAVADRPSGWAMEVLPFMEEANLYRMIDFKTTWASPANQQAARNRPALFVCPVIPEENSTMTGVGITSYILVIEPGDRVRPNRGRSWRIKHLPEGSTYPWCTSPEVEPAKSNFKQPHPDAFGFFN